MAGCDPVSLSREISDLGIESIVAEPGRPQPGEEWWPYPLDAWPLANLSLYTGRTGAGQRIPVARPGNTGEVARLAAWASRRGVCLIPRGGGSGVLGAAAWRDCCVIVDLQSLDHVRVDPASQVVEAGAGAVVARIEEEARLHGLTLALEPQSFYSATIGGMLQTLGSGLLQPGIGNVEDVLVYVDVVLAGGKLLRAGSERAPRGLQPYGMEHLFLGAEGTLGIIVGAGLRLRRIPRHKASRTYRFPSVSRALEAARRLVQWNQPALIRVFDAAESSLFFGEQGPLLLVLYVDDEDQGIPEALASKADRVASSLGAERARDVYEEWYARRYSYGDLVKRLAEDMGLWFDTIDLQAPWPALERLSAELEQAPARIKGVAASFYHVSHFYLNGGSLYLTLAVEQRPEALWRAWSWVMNKAIELGAATTHHHGIGLQKMPWLSVTPGQGSMELYCAVKRALDPGRVLNPHGPASGCRG